MRESEAPAICGRPGFDLFVPAGLSYYLGRSLEKRLPVGGWTAPLTAWSLLDTPAGRRLFRLSASARHKSASAFGLYATPIRSDTKGSVSLETSLKRLAQSSRGVRLPEQAIRIEGRSGSLNPAFVCWLMGYPPEWLSHAPVSVTRSFRKSRQR
jgi:hypothetical protein